MKRLNIALLALTTACALLLAGCMPVRELKDMDIVEGMGVDMTDDGQFLVTYQIFESQAEGGNEMVRVLQSTGETLFDAGRNLTMQTGKRLYYANQSAFVIGREVAVQGIEKIIDFFTRNHELRVAARIFVADGKAVDILSAKGKNGFIPASTIEQASRHEQYTGEILDIQGVEMFERISTGLDDVLLPVVTRRADTVSSSSASSSDSSGTSGGSQGGDTTSRKADSASSGSEGAADVLEIQRAAVFDRDLKLAGYLDPMQTRGYNWTNSGRVKGDLVLTMPDGSHVSVEIKNNTGSLSVAEDGFIFHIKVTASLVEQQDVFTNVLDVSYREKLIHMIDAQVEQEVHSTVALTFFTMKCDVLRIGSNYYRYLPDQWRKMSKDWPESGQNLKYTVDVETSLRASG